MNTLHSLIDIFVFICSVICVSSKHGRCNYKFNKYNATFNVCPLELTTTASSNGYYTVNDARYDNDSEKIVKYYFNIGNSVLNYPSELCTNISSGPCINYTSQDDSGKCSKYERVAWKTWAYSQEFNPNDTKTPIKCVHLTNNSMNGDMKISISDWGTKDIPTEGVELQVMYGDYNNECPYNSNTGKNSNFAIKLECADNIENIPDQEQVFYVNSKCLYWIKLKSIYGCPVECKQYDSKLCAGNGICAYDFTNTIPKCLCFKGYETNDDCSQYKEEVVNILAATNDELPNAEYTYRFNTTKNDTEILYDTEILHIDNGGEYKIIDEESNWIYLIDLDSYIDETLLPTVCKTQTGKPCKVFDNNNNTCIEYENIENGKGFAFRYELGINPKCQLMATNFKWDLYDNNEPSKGLSWIALNGEYCGGSNSGGINENRGGILNIICNNINKTSLKPIKEFSAIMYTQDAYSCKVETWTEWGVICPWNCLTKITDEKWEVCSLHGTCLFDPNAGFVRCICDKGYQGSNCQTITRNNKSHILIINWIKTHILSIVIISFVVIFFIVIIIFWKYYSKLKKKYKNKITRYTT
eukprot:450240_1